MQVAKSVGDSTRHKSLLPGPGGSGALDSTGRQESWPDLACAPLLPKRVTFFSCPSFRGLRFLIWKRWGSAWVPSRLAWRFIQKPSKLARRHISRDSAECCQRPPPFQTVIPSPLDFPSPSPGRNVSLSICSPTPPLLPSHPSATRPQGILEQTYLP